MENKNKLAELIAKRVSWDTYSYYKFEAPKTKKVNLADKEVLESEKAYKEALAFVKDAISPAYMKIFQNKIFLHIYLYFLSRIAFHLFLLL